MNNPQAIQVHCDGAMNYDSKQTGGNGFIIEFPDFCSLEPISRSIKNDGQGIHRLEMISIIEAMEELLSFFKIHPSVTKKVAGVEFYTDRFHITDSEFTNPFRVKNWRKNGWKNFEGKEIKNKDLLDKIDKLRIKISKVVVGPVSINYEREKRNKTADKLARAGKTLGIKGRKIINKKQRHVIKRIYDDVEVKYENVRADEIFEGRVYAWELVGKHQYQVCFEICSGELEGKIIKAYVNAEQKSRLHRSYKYSIKVTEVFSHHITIYI